MRFTLYISTVLALVFAVLVAAQETDAPAATTIVAPETPVASPTMLPASPVATLLPAGPTMTAPVGTGIATRSGTVVVGGPGAATLPATIRTPPATVPSARPTSTSLALPSGASTMSGSIVTAIATVFAAAFVLTAAAAF
ncbi:hypothetical protein DFS34DRAFT_650318 [Phlyctochytrium arcticum]|nr:hypothetical protein DFS34DRAFT_650318 [Phlyctochytrium arcticum]